MAAKVNDNFNTGLYFEWNTIAPKPSEFFMNTFLNLIRFESNLYFVSALF